MSLSEKEKLIFLAGVFEGEGTMGYWKNGITKNGKVMRRIQCAVKMTDKDIIDRFEFGLYLFNHTKTIFLL